VKPAPSHLLPSIAVAMCGAVWGVYWVPFRYFESQGIGGGWISLAFCLTSMLAMLPWLLQRHAWKGLRNEALTGLLMGTGFTLYSVSLVMTDIVNALLLFYLAPIWGSLATWLALKHPMTSMRMLAIALGFAGTGLILGAKNGIPIPRNPGDWLAILSGILWSIGGLNAFLRPSEGAALPMFCFSTGGALASLFIIVISALGGFALANTGAFFETAPWMVLASLVFFVPPNLMVLWASKRLDPGRVSVLLMTEALVGSISAALYAGESLTSWKLAGAILIMTAGCVEILGRAPQAKR
jgi:drug/metabolite transporter (DMT)-like permease